MKKNYKLSEYRGLVCIRASLKGLFILAIICIAMSCSNGSPQKNNSATPDDIHREKIFQTLQDAAKSGKQNVYIYADEKPSVIQKGDLVFVNVTAFSEDGKLISTTSAEIGNRPNNEWLRGFSAERYYPVAVIAGEKDGPPGVNEAVVGMKDGEKKTITVPAEKAFGARDPEKIKQYPAVRKLPRLAQLAPLSFVQQFGKFPVKGKKIDFNPYLDAGVVDVFESHVVLELTIKSKDRMEEVTYGSTRVALENDEFVIRLTPEIGAMFEIGEQQGWITESRSDTFTVDFNHPMAGKAMTLEVEIVDFTKASVADSYEIPWLEDYETGSERSRKESKPMVLLLYADWCQWSQRLMNDVLEDPRIARLHESFVWVKIDSDMHREYKEGFEQKSYPKLLILSPHEEVIMSLDGFNNVQVVSRALMEAHLSESPS